MARDLAKELRLLADKFWAAGFKEMADVLHNAARNFENKVGI